MKVTWTFTLHMNLNIFLKTRYPSFYTIVFFYSVDLRSDGSYRIISSHVETISTVDLDQIM